MLPSDPPFSRSKYQAAYELFYPLAEAASLKLYRAPLAWFNFEKNLFDQAWTYDYSLGWHVVQTVKPDLIEDRAAYSPKNHELKLRLAQLFPLLNHPEFSKIANSKYATSLLLPQHFKPYHKVDSTDALEKTLSCLKGNFIVAKPEFGSGGEGVIIETRDNLLEQKSSLKYPLILQEFIDSSHGIPSITPGHHDLRLVFINDELVYSYIRIPKEGSLLANIAQGGTMEIVPSEKLPSSIDKIILDVQRVFAHFPRKIYTIDIIFDESARPWIVELNTMPGIYFEPGQESTRDLFYTKLIQTLAIFS